MGLDVKRGPQRSMIDWPVREFFPHAIIETADYSLPAVSRADAGENVATISNLGNMLHGFQYIQEPRRPVSLRGIYR
jgi:hypothetical protein